MRRGSYNVYPRNVEEVLYERPAVRGVPHKRLGEKGLVAYAARQAEAQVEKGILSAFPRQCLACFKRPQSMTALDVLLRKTTGEGCAISAAAE